MKYHSKKENAEKRIVAGYNVSDSNDTQGVCACVSLAGHMKCPNVHVE